jgi:signal transduction histidine kinase
MDTTSDLTLPCLIHDLNNVFQTLVEAADLLSDDPRWAQISAAIFRSVERGKEITQSMQTVNQPSAPLETVLKKAQTLMEDSLMSGRGPDVRFACEIEPGLVLHHSWAWERVLINLFSNSVHAMPEGGTISIRARRVTDSSRQQGCIEIVVADEGGGIAPELLPSIFEPNVSTRKGGGLGLHIVHTIVSQEDGEVRAANRSGRGAEFTITIPATPVLTHSASA